MKTAGFLIFCTAISMSAFSQKKVAISDKYYGEVYIESPDEVFSPGWITINDVSTNKQLIRVESEELAVDYTPEGEVKINVMELPYGEQSVIIYDDFNFDGIKDFAIEDGQNSCYHGPSFQIYLADGKGGFDLSSEFTELAQFYCGMFSYDGNTKRISTMTKSGCCWHQFSEFEVVNNKPEPIKIEKEALVTNGCFVENSISEKINGKMKGSTQYSIVYDAEVLLSFKVAKNGKEVVLFKCDDDLRYAFLTKDGIVEFAYPSISDIGNSNPYDFSLHRDGMNLKDEWINFSNDDADYEIYNEQNKVGIKVTTKGKIYNMIGDLSTRKGFVAPIYFDPNKKLENVNFEDDK